MITLKSVLLLFFLYIVCVMVPEYLFSEYIERLRRRGVTVNAYMMSIFQSGQAFIVPKTPLELSLMLLQVAGYTVFLEETLFRIVPYMVAGLAGTVIGSIIWALLHNVKIYNANTHLRYSTIRKILLAHTLMFSAIAVFYIYATTVALWMPYIFHAANNASVAVFMYRSLGNAKIEEKYFTEGEPRVRRAKSKAKTSTKRGTVKPVIASSVSPIGSKYVEPLDARELGIGLDGYTIYVAGRRRERF